MNSNRATASLVTQGLSATAVVLSLIFVALEVRESARQTELNTQSLQVGTYQDLVAQVAVVQTVMLEDPGLRLRLREAYYSPWEELSPDQQAELSSIAFLLLRYGDLAFYQHEVGMLSDERLQTAFGALRGLLFCRRAFPAFWELQRDNYTESYQQFISEILSEQQCG